MLKGLSGLTITINYSTLYSVKYSQLSAKRIKYVGHQTYG